MPKQKYKEIKVTGDTPEKLVPLFEYCREAGYVQTYPLTSDDEDESNIRFSGGDNTFEFTLELESGLNLRLQISSIMTLVADGLWLIEAHLIDTTGENPEIVYDLEHFCYGESHNKFALIDPSRDKYHIDDDEEESVTIIPQIALLTEAAKLKKCDEAFNAHVWRYLCAQSPSDDLLEALYLATNVFSWDAIFMMKGEFSEEAADSARNRVVTKLIQYKVNKYIANAAVETMLLMARVYHCNTRQLEYIFRRLFVESNAADAGVKD